MKRAESEGIEESMMLLESLGDLGYLATEALNAGLKRSGEVVTGWEVAVRSPDR